LNFLITKFWGKINIKLTIIVFLKFEDFKILKVLHLKNIPEKILTKHKFKGVVVAFIKVVGTF
jgi:hypothetical protein